MPAYPTIEPLSAFACWRERLHAGCFRLSAERRLRSAISRNNLRLVSEILAKGEFDVNATLSSRPDPSIVHPQTGFTLLHLAAQSDSFEMVELLLSLGANPATKTNWHVTPMHFAAMQANAHVVALLASCGASTLDQFPSLSHYYEEDPYTPTSPQILASMGVPEYVGDEHARYRAHRDASTLGAKTPHSHATMSLRARL